MEKENLGRNQERRNSKILFNLTTEKELDKVVLCMQ